MQGIQLQPGHSARVTLTAFPIADTQRQLQSDDAIPVVTALCLLQWSTAPTLHFFEGFDSLLLESSGSPPLLNLCPLSRISHVVHAACAVATLEWTEHNFVSSQ